MHFLMLEMGFVILFFLIRELTISILNCRSFWYFIIKNVFRKIKINYNLKWRECCLLTWEPLQIQCTSRFGNRVIDQWSKCNRRNEILCSLRLNDCHVGPMLWSPHGSHPTAEEPVPEQTSRMRRKKGQDWSHILCYMDTFQIFKLLF